MGTSWKFWFWLGMKFGRWIATVLLGVGGAVWLATYLAGKGRVKPRFG